MCPIHGEKGIGIVQVTIIRNRGPGQALLMTYKRKTRKISSCKDIAYIRYRVYTQWYHCEYMYSNREERNESSRKPSGEYSGVFTLSYRE